MGRHARRASTCRARAPRAHARAWSLASSVTISVTMRSRRDSRPVHSRVRPRGPAFGRVRAGERRAEARYARVPRWRYVALVSLSGRRISRALSVDAGALFDGRCRPSDRDDGRVVAPRTVDGEALDRAMACARVLSPRRLRGDQPTERRAPRHVLRGTHPLVRAAWVPSDWCVSSGLSPAQAGIVSRIAGSASCPDVSKCVGQASGEGPRARAASPKTEGPRMRGLIGSSGEAVDAAEHVRQ